MPPKMVSVIFEGLAAGRGRPVAWNSKMDLCAIGSDAKGIEIVRLPWQKVSSSVTSDVPVCTCWSLDGGRFAVGTEKGLVEIFEVGEGRLVRSISTGKAEISQISSLVWHYDDTPLERRSSLAESRQDEVNKVPLLAWLQDRDRIQLSSWNGDQLGYVELGMQGDAVSFSCAPLGQSLWTWSADSRTLSLFSLDPILGSVKEVIELFILIDKLNEMFGRICSDCDYLKQRVDEFCKQKHVAFSSLSQYITDFGSHRSLAGEMHHLLLIGPTSPVLRHWIEAYPTEQIARLEAASETLSRSSISVLKSSLRPNIHKAVSIVDKLWNTLRNSSAIDSLCRDIVARLREVSEAAVNQAFVLRENALQFAGSSKYFYGLLSNAALIYAPEGQQTPMPREDGQEQTPAAGFVQFYDVSGLSGFLNGDFGCDRFRDVFEGNGFDQILAGMLENVSRLSQHLENRAIVTESRSISLGNGFDHLFFRGNAKGVSPADGDMCAIVSQKKEECKMQFVKMDSGSVQAAAVSLPEGISPCNVSFLDNETCIMVYADSEGIVTLATLQVPQEFVGPAPLQDLPDLLQASATECTAVTFLSSQLIGEAPVKSFALGAERGVASVLLEDAKLLVLDVVSEADESEDESVDDG